MACRRCALWAALCVAGAAGLARPHASVSSSSSSFTRVPISSAMPALAGLDAQPRRLTLEEEGRLAGVAQREQALQAKRYALFQQLGRTPTADEWAKAALGADCSPQDLGRVRRESVAAKHALVRANGGLVVSIARGYQRLRTGAGVEALDDLVQEGTLGLIRAVEKYEPERGIRFGTYATAWIKASISAWLKRGDAMIKVPSRVADLGLRAARSSSALQNDLGRDATAEEVARDLGASTAAVEAAASALHGSRVVSYDAKTTGGDSESDFVACLADEECAVGDLKADLTNALAAVLDDRELRVVRLRYGLDDGTQRSTRECAAALGIGKESVRQICLKAFRKLRGTAQGSALLSHMD